MTFKPQNNNGRITIDDIPHAATNWQDHSTSLSAKINVLLFRHNWNTVSQNAIIALHLSPQDKQVLTMY